LLALLEQSAHDTTEGGKRLHVVFSMAWISMRQA
jgi:hypothetical protein